MNYKETFFSLLNSYLLFGLIYSGVIWLIWTFLFANATGFSLSFLQVFGLYVMTRILVGNSSHQYISNYYSPRPFDANELDKRLEEIKQKYSEDFDIQDESNKRD